MSDKNSFISSKYADEFIKEVKEDENIPCNIKQMLISKAIVESTKLLIEEKNKETNKLLEERMKKMSDDLIKEFKEDLESLSKHIEDENNLLMINYIKY